MMFVRVPRNQLQHWQVVSNYSRYGQPYLLWGKTDILPAGCGKPFYSSFSSCRYTITTSRYTTAYLSCIHLSCLQAQKKTQTQQITASKCIREYMDAKKIRMYSIINISSALNMARTLNWQSCSTSKNNSNYKLLVVGTSYMTFFSSKEWYIFLSAHIQITTTTP